MGWKNLSDKRAHRGRRARLMSKQGRAFELEVAKILTRLLEEEKISDFQRHEPSSEEDHDGKDFTVCRKIGEEVVSRSFGVTISLRSWADGKVKHPDVPQFCFPLGTKPETIEKKILSLFTADKASSQDKPA